MSSDWSSDNGKMENVSTLSLHLAHSRDMNVLLLVEQTTLAKNEWKSVKSH